MGKLEAVVARPRIGRKATTAPQFVEVCTVDDDRFEVETGAEFILPSLQHRRRCRNDDELDAVTEEELAYDEACLDRLAEPHIIGDQQIDARQSKSFGERLEFIGLEPNASPDGSFEEAWTASGHSVPAGPAQMGSEHRLGIEAAIAELLEARFGEDLGVELFLPENRKTQDRVIFVGTDQNYEMIAVVFIPRINFIDQLSEWAYADKCARLKFQRTRRCIYLVRRVYHFAKNTSSRCWKVGGSPHASFVYSQRTAIEGKQTFLVQSSLPGKRLSNGNRDDVEGVPVAAGNGIESAASVLQSAEPPFLSSPR